MWAASVPLAVIAALLFAVSAALQQSAARSAALAEPRPQRWLQALYLLSGLMRNKRWLAGWAANIVGFGLHAVALHYGSITMVQALLVLQLLFALPMAVARRRRRPLVRDWIGTLLVCTGLVTIVVQELPHGEVRREVLPHAAAVALVTIVLLVCAAQLAGAHAQTRSALVAIAAGLCFCMTAVLLVLATDDLPHVSWPLPCLALTTVTGGLLVQEAFASGSLPTALTTTTITDPVASYLAGLTLFEMALRPNLFALTAAALLIAGGVVLLANSPTLHDERDIPGNQTEAPELLTQR